MPSGSITGAGSAHLIRAWSVVMDQAVPDSSKSFLDLGGDSLRGAQLCALLAAEFGIDVPLRSLLEAPTLGTFLAQTRARARRGEVVSAPASALPAPDGGQLSWSQERMCFLHELATGSAAYHVAMAWRLRGTLDSAALHTAFENVVARHDVLRTAITVDGEQLVPRFDGAARPELVEVSWAAERHARRLESLDDYLCHFTNSPFQLDGGALLRAALIHLETNDAVLVAVFHHVAADQWTLDVFFRELASCYAAALAQQPPSLPPAGDFARWSALHRRWYEQERQASDTAWWTRQLHGLEPTALDEDFVRPAQQSFAGARLSLDFGVREIRALRAFGATQGATLAMVLLAALKVLLMRHTGRNDIAVGVPVADREDPLSWELMGTMVNTLVLRTELDPRADFLAALAQVRAGMLDALEHQGLPFDQLVRTLRIERDPSRPALFTVMFNMLNTPLGAAQFPGIEWSRREFDRKAAQFDLQVTVDADHARTVAFEYATALFSAETIQRLAERYMELLREILRDAQRPLDIMALLPEAELRLLREWSQGPRRPRSTQAVDGLIWPGLIAHGNRPAVTAGEETLSYDQLRQLAEQYSRGLMRLGAGPGSLVGLHLSRTPRMLAALLAVLRAGAAYVPLDPAFPPHRLAFMAADAGLALLVTDSSAGGNADAWPPGCRCATIEELLAAGAAPVTPQERAGLAGPADTAYVLYTSGSTGNPKGVAIPHSAVVNFLQAMQEQPGLDASDRVLAITTLSFDIAVLELLLPLVAGARIILARREEQTDGEALRALLDRHAITVMQATPATWRLLLDSGWQGSMELRALVGGEPLTRDLANELQLRSAQVWNMYGPTETTVWSSCDRVGPPGRDRISLGLPIANTTILVLDESRGLCPAGVPGEICIGGDGLAIGYLNQPQLTAERFIDNPHSRDRRSARLYRTGDRGRWRTDGKLEHLGRLDAQVKVRGYRIEPGEIEARLSSHPDVASSVVLVDTRGGTPMLLAYLVCGARAPGARELREFLRQWLPEYMVPQHFIPLAQLPRLPNGKLDRKALPLPHPGDALDEPGTAPRNPTEEAVWHIWSQALRSESFGIHDNLFDIGGHSLLAVQIANRIRADLRQPCSLALLLRNPTVAALAAALDSTDQADSTVVPLQAGGVGPELFCLCGITLYRELAGMLAGHVPVCAVFVPDEMAMFAGAGAEGSAGVDIPRLARAYLETIRGRQPQGPYRLLGFSFGGVVAYEVAQQLRAEGETVALLAILDSDVPGPEASGLRRSLRRLAAPARELVRRLLGRHTQPAAGEGVLDEARYAQAMRTYLPRPYPGLAFYVRSQEPHRHDPGYGWDRLLGAPHTLAIADTHLGILKGQSVRLLGAQLRDLLR